MNRVHRAAARVFILTLLSLLIAAVPVAGSTEQRAQGMMWTVAEGTQALVETADPAIRDGGWSCVRVAAGGPSVSFGEVGWIKWADGRRRVFVSSRDTDNNLIYGEYYSPGWRHEYRVSHRNNGTWWFYVDNQYLTSRYLGFTQTTNEGSGGEVSSSANAMGVSGCLYNYYRVPGTGVWVSYPYHLNWEDAGYHVADISAFSWQVYGNN
jgi:hypothetical protein